MRLWSWRRQWRQCYLNYQHVLHQIILKFLVSDVSGFETHHRLASVFVIFMCTWVVFWLSWRLLFCNRLYCTGITYQRGVLDAPPLGEVIPYSTASYSSVSSDMWRNSDFGTLSESGVFEDMWTYSCWVCISLTIWMPTPTVLCCPRIGDLVDFKQVLGFIGINWVH